MNLFARFFSSLQTRLIVLTVTVATVLWLIAAALAWSETSHEVDELLDAHLAQSAALLISQQATHGTNRNETSDELPLLHKYSAKVAFQVFQNNALVWHSTQLEHEVFDRSKTGFFEITDQENQKWRVFTAKDDVHNIQVFVAEQSDERYGIVEDVLASLTIPLFSVIVALGVMVGITTHATLSPLRNLSRKLAQRSPSDTDALIIGDLPQEIKPIVKALNHLFIKIHELLDQQKRFNADAAHELRTPIASIRTQAQVAMQANLQNNSTEEVNALNATLSGCDRAVRLVDQLLTLSKLESREAFSNNLSNHNSSNESVKTEQTDLTQVCQNIALDLSSDALKKNQDLEFIGPEKLIVTGSFTLWEILVRNILDNAIRYSPHDAKIRLEIAQHHQQWALTIDDSGPSLSPDQIKKLGERFYRVLGTNEVGSGLGWSIVRRVASELAVPIEVKNSELLGGLRVEIYTSVVDEKN